MANTDPKIATQEQWEDLATKVNNKAGIGSVLSTPSSVEYVNTANIADGAVTKDKIDWSSIKFKAGDTYTITQTMTGQVRNLSNASQNDIGYFTVILPFEVDTGVTVSLDSFSIGEIENIGYVSSSSVINVQDSNNQKVSLDQTHMTAAANFDASNRRSLILVFKLKDGYHWDGATSYNAVQFRTTRMTFTFSAAS